MLRTNNINLLWTLFLSTNTFFISTSALWIIVTLHVRRELQQRKNWNSVNMYFQAFKIRKTFQGRAPRPPGRLKFQYLLFYKSSTGNFNRFVESGTFGTALPDELRIPDYQIVTGVIAKRWFIGTTKVGSKLRNA